MHEKILQELDNKALADDLERRDLWLNILQLAENFCAFGGEKVPTCSVCRDSKASYDKNPSEQFLKNLQTGGATLDPLYAGNPRSGSVNE